MNPGICREKQRLSDEMVEALRVLTGLQNDQTTDLIQGGAGLPHIEAAIQRARSQWERSKNAYKAHMREHACS